MSFDRTRLPDPLTYYDGQGLIFRERKGKWRTTSCLNCASSDAMRINTDSGSFVCMTGCGARGGDVLAYHQAAHGLGFVDAAKALGAWIDDGKDTARTRPTPLPARDALVVLAAEANLVAVAAASVAHGVVLTQIDLARLLTASGRITFMAVYEQWLTHRKLSLEEGRQTSLSQIGRVFKKDVFPALRHLTIYEITRPHLLEIIGKVEKRGSLSVAEKLRTWFFQLFTYAAVTVPDLGDNPAKDLGVVALPLPPVDNNPFLRMPELPLMLQTLRKYRGRLNTQLGLRLLFLTGVRTGELRFATPDQFDLDRGLWIIPVARLKQRNLLTKKRRKRLIDIARAPCCACRAGAAGDVGEAVLPLREQFAGQRAHRCQRRGRVAACRLAVFHPMHRQASGRSARIRAVAEQGSISGAARSLGMGYKRAWSLLDELQRAIPTPVIETAAGGSEGGGATVTPSGLALLAQYDELERACTKAFG